MSSSIPYAISSSDISVSDSLLISLFLAAVLHVFIFFGINFTIPEPEINTKHIEVTLVHSTTTKKPPKTARFLADDHQIAAGNKTSKPAPTKEKSFQKKSDTKKNTVKPRQKPAPQKAEPTRAKPQPKVISSKQAESKIQNEKNIKPVKKSNKLDAMALQQQIAQMGARIRHSKPSSEFSKIKFVSSVSTHKYIAAQYMKDWEDKIERTGNLNYPEVARQRGFSGTLTMDVGIAADGRIYSMRISKSSGNKALDDAAKRIVRLSAPFAELPDELLKELDVLVIPRVWKFSDESGITTR